PGSAARPRRGLLRPPGPEGGGLVIRTLAWKEYRERCSVWLVMLVLAGGLLYALTLIHAPQGALSTDPEKLWSVILASLCTVSTYGLVCGAMMLAGERESRTLVFLDTLPALRMQLWWAKLLIGGMFTFTQALSVMAVASFLGLTETPALPAGWVLALPFAALE